MTCHDHLEGIPVYPIFRQTQCIWGYIAEGDLADFPRDPCFFGGYPKQIQVYGDMYHNSNGWRSNSGVVFFPRVLDDLINNKKHIAYLL